MSRYTSSTRAVQSLCLRVTSERCCNAKHFVRGGLLIEATFTSLVDVLTLLSESETGGSEPEHLSEPVADQGCVRDSATSRPKTRASTGTPLKEIVRADVERRRSTGGRRRCALFSAPAPPLPLPALLKSFMPVRRSRPRSADRRAVAGWATRPRREGPDIRFPRFRRPPLRRRSVRDQPPRATASNPTTRGFSPGFTHPRCPVNY